METGVTEAGGTSWVTIAVVDSGVGISPEDLSRVFEPFYTSKSDAGGTGLGLPVCKSIVEEAGGRIDIVSSPGEGATVTLSLPAVPNVEEEEA